MNRRPNHQRTRPGQHNKPRTPRFDAEATRNYLNEVLTKSEISYLVQIFIDKGKNFDRNDKFNGVWSKIASDENVVTLSRIVHAFPEVTCKYLQSCPDRPISLRECIKQSGCADFPTIARQTSCATLIPENFNFRAEALDVIMMASMLFSEKIQTSDIAALSPLERLRHNFEFVQKSFESSVLLEGDRWELCSQFGIVNEDASGLSEPWMTASEAASTWLKKTYSSNIQVKGSTVMLTKSVDGLDVL